MAETRTGSRKSKPKSKEGADEDDLEDIEYKLPDFDEQDFIRKEVRDARLAVVVLLYAAVLAVVSRAVGAVGGPVGLAFFAGLVGLTGIRTLVRFARVDPSELEAKSWLGLGAVAFFAWLGFWTLLLNAPFG